MSERGRSIARIVALQSKVKTLAAARLALAEAAKAEIAANREALDAFVDGAALTGALAVQAIGQARRLARREAEAENRRLPLAAARQQAETRLKLAERVAETIGREEEAAAERQALEHLIEAAVGREPAEEAP